MRKVLIIVAALIILAFILPWWVIGLIPVAFFHYLIFGRLMGAKRWWLPVALFGVALGVLNIAAVILDRVF